MCKNVPVPIIRLRSPYSFFFFFNDTATTEIYTLSLHDALPICRDRSRNEGEEGARRRRIARDRSEEHTSELQSPKDLVCRLLLEKKKHIKARSSSLLSIKEEIGRANV